MKGFFASTSSNGPRDSGPPADAPDAVRRAPAIQVWFLQLSKPFTHILLCATRLPVGAIIIEQLDPAAVAMLMSNCCSGTCQMSQVWQTGDSHSVSKHVLAQGPTTQGQSLQIGFSGLVCLPCHISRCPRCGNEGFVRVNVCTYRCWRRRPPFRARAPRPCSAGWCTPQMQPPCRISRCPMLWAPA